MQFCVNMHHRKQTDYFTVGSDHLQIWRAQ